MRYRLYQHVGLVNKLTVVGDNDFYISDGYDETKFFMDESDNIIEFYTEDKAIEWLNKNVKPDRIDPDYIKIKWNREDWLL